MRVPPRRCGLRGVACHAGVAYRQGGAGAARPRLPGAGPGPGQGVRAGWRFPRAGGGGTIGPHRGGRAMRRTTSTILALCALAALAGRADDPEPPAGAKAELKKLQGTWTVTKVVRGKAERKSPGTTYTFDADKVTRSSPYPGEDKEKRSFRATFDVKLDTSKKPYRMELAVRAGSKGLAAASKSVCIYKVEKGELCLAEGRGGQVPKDFSGKDAQVYVMRKEAKKGGK